MEQAAPANWMILGNVVINPRTYGVAVDGSPVELTFSEFELLSRLCQEPDRVIDYDTLCKTIWPGSGHREKRRLNVAICRIRAKLALSQPYKVETVRGRGYGFLASRTYPPALQQLEGGSP